MDLEFPEDLKYLDTHEYIRLDGEIATIGISSYAIEQLGDLVFLELPEVGDSLELGTSFGSIESVKAAEDLYPPVSGTVVDRNEEMIESPEAIADDPYGDGWLLKVRIENLDDESEDTMSAQDYRALVEGEET
ncbi:glycine cleavage system protein GcvH [Crocosphaera watsonii WH 8501]|uniref:Glycine cleavage system H protein n=6 Tax=Crocosphaera watsonii TaxID=263511 RepID=Q4C5I0_CROWT|nr:MULTISPECIES: glycine cleavage system protein GcvH [Crocosphaera]EAM51472.1 Glycine cleavage H-protein [Crocosphaera watsonii WH 8501]EHJ12714.1 Glycine cleavage system H protein [Crocosphaera watsonii WH 0003]NQZ64781.1 glycine cleavage system protein GcvH [Crocosphaera sp.]CCQ49209.1 Glycine cleavage system H protein [Crocosphaera watsonii WH 8502]CCQ58057.1 Glycine cleavage system H protein [Crocosphaera watsonii WH 0005]